MRGEGRGGRGVEAGFSVVCPARHRHDCSMPRAQSSMSPHLRSRWDLIQAKKEKKKKRGGGWGEGVEGLREVSGGVCGVCVCVGGGL